MTFQDGRHSILSLVCLALLCSVFKVRFFLSFKLRIQYLSFYLNTEVYFRNFILFSFNKAWSEARTQVLASEHNAVKRKNGGLKWTRTIDLPLIRRTL